jgi:hypothetical protein
MFNFQAAYGYGMILGILLTGLVIIFCFVGCFVYSWHIKLQRKYQLLRMWRSVGPVTARSASNERVSKDLTVHWRTSRPPSIYYIQSVSEEDKLATIPENSAAESLGLDSVVGTALNVQAFKRGIRGSVFVRRNDSIEEEDEDEEEEVNVDATVR